MFFELEYAQLYVHKVTHFQRSTQIKDTLRGVYRDSVFKVLLNITLTLELSGVALEPLEFGSFHWGAAEEGGVLFVGHRQDLLGVEG